MKGIEKIVIKIDTTKVPNKMHLAVQQNTRANVFKPKKGKGSYTRKSKYGKDY